MGSFAKSLAGILFGWVSNVFSGIWAMFTTDSGTESIPWFGKQWILIVVLLCVLGMVIDFVVYLYRWKPYRVWASFFRRRGSDNREQQELREYFPDKETYQDEIVSEEETSSTVDSEQPEVISQWLEEETAEKDISMDEREAEASDPYARYRRPVTEIQTAGPEEDDNPFDRWQTGNENKNDERNTFRSQNANGMRRRRIVRTLLGEDEQDEFTFSSASRPAPVIDREEAYHEPVYPPQWKQNRQSGDMHIHDQGSI